MELALDLLREGSEAVQIDQVVLRRDAVGAHADNHIHAAILPTYEPLSLTKRQADEDIQGGRALIRDLIAADSRFAALATQHGVTIEYVHDYGMGSVLLARIADDGSVSWQEPFQPRT